MQSRILLHLLLIEIAQKSQIFSDNQAMLYEVAVTLATILVILSFKNVFLNQLCTCEALNIGKFETANYTCNLQCM